MPNTGIAHVRIVFTIKLDPQNPGFGPYLGGLVGGPWRPFWTPFWDPFWTMFQTPIFGPSQGPQEPRAGGSPYAMSGMSQKSCFRGLGRPLSRPQFGTPFWDPKSLVLEDSKP